MGREQRMAKQHEHRLNRAVWREAREAKSIYFAEDEILYSSTSTWKQRDN